MNSYNFFIYEFIEIIMKTHEFMCEFWFLKVPDEAL